jgi:FKBP-type peptidyl-prolyl cis-trans isomerase
MRRKGDTSMRAIKIVFLASLLLSSCLDVTDHEAIQLQDEIKAINNYLSGVTFKKVTKGNNSGIQIGITSFGSGAPPHNGQTVKVSYTGRLLSDWSIFETGTIDDVLESIPVRGLRYGIESIPEGTQATIFMASSHAFGKVGTEKVPPNATIAYEVVLEKVVMTDLELVQFKADTTTIRNYLAFQKIKATKVANGIWYSSDDAGTGTKPTLYDLISFTYKGSLLSTGSVFQEGEISKQIMFDLIDGLKIGLPLIKNGTRATFYIPSGLGYGTNASSTIPANSNLIFEIKLNGVE